MFSLLAVTELDIVTIVVGVLGGLALFLFGMGRMTDALKMVAGGGMRLLLDRLTKNRFLAAITGAIHRYRHGHRRGCSAGEQRKIEEESADV